MTASSFTVPALSDYHVHLRDVDSAGTAGLLAGVAPASARCCGRVLVMPNTQPPLRTAADGTAYLDTVTRHLGAACTAVASLCLDEDTTADLVRAVAGRPGLVAFKLYPRGVTTHSAEGVGREALTRPQDYPRLVDALGAMEQAGLVLQLHGEMPGQENPLRREPDFLPFVSWVLGQYPRLRVVLEHITSRAAVAFVQARANDRLAATITCHHLYFHLGHLLGSATEDRLGYGDGKIHPHLHCWPCAKEPEDRQALREVVLAGHPNFFLGSDSAPHRRADKESACGCAGVFAAPALAEALAGLLDRYSALDRMGGFVAEFGDRFYRLPSTGRRLRLVKQGWTVPYEVAGVVPFLAGKPLRWRAEDA